MKRINNILFIFSILGILIFLMFLNKDILIGMLPEKLIGEYLLRKTPIKSNRNDVRTFIKQKKYEIMWDIDYPHTLRPDVVTVPEQPPRVKNYLNPENRRGSKNIFVCVINIFGIVSVMCAWVFDDNEELLFIGVSKEWNIW